MAGRTGKWPLMGLLDHSVTNAPLMDSTVGNTISNFIFTHLQGTLVTDTSEVDDRELAILVEKARRRNGVSETSSIRSHLILQNLMLQNA